MVGFSHFVARRPPHLPAPCAPPEDGVALGGYHFDLRAPAAFTRRWRRWLRFVLVSHSVRESKAQTCNWLSACGVKVWMNRLAGRFISSLRVTGHSWSQAAQCH